MASFCAVRPVADSMRASRMWTVVCASTVCIAGGMPSSLLQTGTPDQVRDYTKKVIDELGRDSGFIMCTSTVLDDANPELVEVWAETTKEYGQY
jgi:hypothetical protein